MYHTIIVTVCSKAEETSRTGEECTAPLSTPHLLFIHFLILTLLGSLTQATAKHKALLQLSLLWLDLSFFITDNSEQSSPKAPELLTSDKIHHGRTSCDKNLPALPLLWMVGPFGYELQGFLSHAAISYNLQQEPIHLLLLEVANLDQTPLANLLQICYCSSILLPHYIPIS